ncbi:MAG: alpha/beta hydrolase [Ramlibacter sp.]|nr:alpha/beta hydrolase [Ramlibacter sp.]
MKLAIKFLAISLALASGAWAQTPAGEIKGSETVHTESSARESILRAQVALPSSVTGGAVYLGPLRAAPATHARAPVVVFMHGSSGLGLKAIGEWQQWLAGMGIASLAPDSFALPDRLTYKSPVDKAVYEKIHALRGSEIALAAKAVQVLAWADASRVVLAGTSEGAVAVARYTGKEFSGRIVFSWSCEDNYFVAANQTALPDDKPILNVMSLTDPYFSQSNTWLGNAAATGYCGAALKTNKLASVVLIPGAPHTLLNLPAARHPVEGFLKDVLKPGSAS